MINEFSFLIRCHNNAQRWKYSISTGNFHLIRICSVFLQISQKWWHSKAKSLVFLTVVINNDFCRLYNEHARALQSWITFFLNALYIWSSLILCDVKWYNVILLTMCHVWYRGIPRFPSSCSKIIPKWLQDGEDLVRFRVINHVFISR